MTALSPPATCPGTADGMWAAWGGDTSATQQTDTAVPSLPFPDLPLPFFTAFP